MQHIEPEEQGNAQPAFVNGETLRRRNSFPSPEVEYAADLAGANGLFDRGVRRRAGDRLTGCDKIELTQFLGQRHFAQQFIDTTHIERLARFAVT